MSYFFIKFKMSYLRIKDESEKLGKPNLYLHGKIRDDTLKIVPS